MKTISVVIPSFNNGRFIDKCLTSIIKQKTSGKFMKEYIVIDNCSTDDTDIILNTYYQSNLLYIREKDDGIMDAWNKGVKNSCGEYISFCNVSDHYYSEYWLNDCLDIMESNPWVSAVYGLTLKIDEVGSKFHGIGGHRVIPILKDNQTPEKCLAAFINHSITWNECTAVLRREAVESLMPFVVDDFGSTLTAMRKFYENGYLSYFLPQIGAVTLLHYDSGANNHQSSEKEKEMWDTHYKKLAEYKNRLVNTGVFNYRNSKSNVLGSVMVR